MDKHGQGSRAAQHLEFPVCRLTAQLEIFILFFFSGIKVKKLGFLSTEIQNAKLAAITAVLQYNDEIFYRNYFCFIYALITDS